MTSPDPGQLRFLVAGLREPRPSRESERRALEAFERLCRTGRHDRRKRDCRRRAVLVEMDRRSGFDRRAGDRRKS